MTRRYRSFTSCSIIGPPDIVPCLSTSADGSDPVFEAHSATLLWKCPRIKKLWRKKNQTENVYPILLVPIAAPRFFFVFIRPKFSLLLPASIIFKWSASNSKASMQVRFFYTISRFKIVICGSISRGISLANCQRNPTGNTIGCYGYKHTSATADRGLKNVRISRVKLRLTVWRESNSRGRFVSRPVNYSLTSSNKSQFCPANKTRLHGLCW